MIFNFLNNNFANTESINQNEQLEAYKVIFMEEPTELIKSLESNQIEFINYYGMQGLSLNSCIKIVTEGFEIPAQVINKLNTIKKI